MTFDEALDRYLKRIQEENNKIYQQRYPNLNLPVYTYTKGSKFIKVIQVTNQQIVYSFIDKNTGDLYKAATWRVPADGVRGNIYQDKYPILFEDLYKHKLNH